MSKQIIWQDLKLKLRLDGMVENELDTDDEDIDSLESLVTTPFGLLKVNDFFNPMKQYSWYMAHVNFNLTKEIFERLNRVQGVERLLPVSRYRFMVAIGLVFDIYNVKSSIENTLSCVPILPKEVIDKQKDLEQIYEKWAIYFNKGQWEYCTEDNFESEILKFEAKQKEEGGILITHDNRFE